MHYILRFRYLLILISSAAINIVSYNYQGVKLVNDSYRYIEYAEKIANGNFYQEHNIWYIAYCAFLSFFIKLKINYEYVILTQIILAIISTLTFCKASEILTKNRKKALCSSLLYLLFFEISLWNNYILTESLFISFTCFFLYFFCRFHEYKLKSDLIISSSILLCIFWLRPMGICLVASFAFYIYFEKIRDLLSKPSRYILGSICFVIGILLINQMLSTFHLVENYATGEIVFGISRIPNYPNHEYILLNVPQDLHLPKEGGTFTRAIKFYFSNPVFSLKLSLGKAFYFVSHIKPYNSFLHNFHTLCLLIPSYISLFYWLKNSKELSLRYFVLSMFASTTVILMVTSEDWDGRFFMGIAPIIFLFAFANKNLFPSFFSNEDLA